MSFVLTKGTDDEYSNEFAYVACFAWEIQAYGYGIFDYFTDESPSLSKVSKFEAEGNTTS